LHPYRSHSLGIDVLDDTTQVTWTAFSADYNLLFISNGCSHFFNFRRSHWQLVNHTNFTCDPANAETVTTVRRDTDVNHIVIKIQIFTNVDTHSCVVW